MPLCPVFAFQDSYQQVRITDVPKKIGDWNIKKVEVECQFPDNQEKSFECTLVGGVWITTINSCSTAGTTKNGFVVNGYDENDNKYILGKSDLYIMTNDSRIIPQKTLDVVNILPSKPETPHVGDAVFVDGKLEVYDGENWISTGSGVVESTDVPGYAENAVFANNALSADYAQNAENAVQANSSGFADVAELAYNAQRASFADGVYWNDVADKPNIPTKTSELENDSGYTTTEYVDYVGTELQGYVGGAIAEVREDIPTKTSELENDSGFLDGSDKDELNERIDLIQATSHPNMNVVGSPTFSQGSVGGFSGDDYLMFPTSVNVGQNNVVFHMSITAGDNVSNQENILDSWCGLALAIQNGHFILAASSNGTTFNVANGSSTVLANTSYDIKIVFSYGEGMYNVGLLVNDANDANISMDAPMFATATYWGGANPSSGVNHIFGGTINLNECWMSWNGEVVWRGYSELPIPTKVSQLDNDVGYATQAYVDEAIGQVLTQEEF